MPVSYDAFLQLIADVLTRAQAEAIPRASDSVDLADIVVAIVAASDVTDALQQKGFTPDFDSLEGHQGPRPPVAGSLPPRLRTLPGGEVKVAPALQTALHKSFRRGASSRTNILLDLLNEASAADPRASQVLNQMKLDIESVKLAVRSAKP